MRLAAVVWHDGYKFKLGKDWAWGKDYVHCAYNLRIANEFEAFQPKHRVRIVRLPRRFNNPVIKEYSLA